MNETIAGFALAFCAAGTAIIILLAAIAAVWLLVTWLDKHDA